MYSLLVYYLRYTENSKFSCNFKKVRSNFNVSKGKKFFDLTFDAESSI